MNKVLHFILFLVWSASCFGQAEIFDRANADFEQGNYDEAISKYESILEQGYESVELYFNLGNSFYKKNEIGKAILNFERALLLQPRDEAVLQNLEIAKAKTTDEIDALPSFFLAEWWRSVRQLLPSGGWGFFGILMLWLGVGGLVVWLLGKTRAQRKKGFLYGFGILLLCLLPLALGFSNFQNKLDNGNAIIMSEVVTLKSGADDASESLRELHEGTKVEIHEKVSNWYKVRLENGEEGWLIENVLEKI